MPQNANIICARGRAKIPICGPTHPHNNVEVEIIINEIATKLCLKRNRVTSNKVATITPHKKTPEPGTICPVNTTANTKITKRDNLNLKLTNKH